MSQLKNELKKIKKRDEELNFIANKTNDYLNTFSVLKEKEAKDLQKKLEGLKITRLKPEQIIKIIDLLPSTVADLKVILQGYPVSIANEDLKKIADVVAGFVPKKK
ncbi:hypothetical protein KY339_00260, partial [Candidatus Woesearchaeota archaeon]|nr:hypothetical protein [Candidatus Woesearchaeota archaeon]